MRLLVTGGTGVLGRALRPLAVEAGHDLVTPTRQELDLFDPAAVGDAIRDVEGVLHLATLDQAVLEGQLHLQRPQHRQDVAMREKALWRLLYETAARSSEALSIKVEDLELENKRVRIRSKGGDTDWLHFQTGAARLLPRLIGGRTRGPLFLADRRPAPARAPATVDRCPQTGRGRLSYRRAEALFRQASGGWTLHQLRHSALTHLAEQNVSLPLLMAKGRHASLRSLQRYARPGADALFLDPGGHRSGEPTQPRPARVGVIRSLKWGRRRLTAEVDKA
jgi:integrase